MTWTTDATGYDGTDRPRDPSLDRQAELMMARQADSMRRAWFPYRSRISTALTHGLKAATDEPFTVNPKE